jgi:hypothetical protein
MPENATVRAPGLRDLQRDLKAMDRDVAKALNKELREVARPVASEAQRLAQRYGPRVAKTIRPGVRAGVATVRQGARRTTGDAPDFGAAQMRDVLVPALEQHADDVERELGNLLDRYAHEHGFTRP